MHLEAQYDLDVAYPSHMDEETTRPERNAPLLTVPEGWKRATLGAPVPVIRCTYIFPDSHARPGEQCKRWSLRGTTICVKHGAQLQSVEKHAAAVVESARLKLIGRADEAADWLIELAEGASSEAVRLKATESVLAIAGIRGGTDVNISIAESNINPADVLKDRLKQLAERHKAALASEAAIIDGVIVEAPVQESADQPSTASNSDASEE